MLMLNIWELFFYTNLNWKAHLHELSKKISTGIGALYMYLKLAIM